MCPVRSNPRTVALEPVPSYGLVRQNPLHGFAYWKASAPDRWRNGRLRGKYGFQPWAGLHRKSVQLVWIWKPHRRLARKTILDANRHGPSLKNALIGAASFYKLQVIAWYRPTQRYGLRPGPCQGCLETFLCEGRRQCFSLAVPLVSHIRGQRESVHG